MKLILLLQTMASMIYFFNKSPFDGVLGFCVMAIAV